MAFDIDIVNELKVIIDKLDQIDKYFDSMGELESNIDMKLSDLYHYIENNTLKTNECYRIVKEIKKQLEIRRHLKEDYTLLSTYKNNHARLNNENNRKMLMTEMHKAKKNLSKKYKNRVYTEEEIKEILGGKRNDRNINNNNIYTNDCIVDNTIN